MHNEQILHEYFKLNNEKCILQIILFTSLSVLGGQFNYFIACQQDPEKNTLVCLCVEQKKLNRRSSKVFLFCEEY